MRILGMLLLMSCFVLWGCNGGKKDQSGEKKKQNTPHQVKGPKKEAGPTDSPEGLGKTVFQALKAKNLEGLRALLATGDDLADSMTRLGLKEEQVQKNRQIWEQAKQKIDKDPHKIYGPILEKINWENAEYVTTVYDLVVYDFEEEEEMEPDRADEILLVVAYEGKKYEIALNDCIKTDRGWAIGIGLIEWRGEPAIK